MKYKYLLFDYDGTICHTHPAISFSLENTFKEFNLDIPGEKARLDIISTGKGLYDTILALHPDKDHVSKPLIDSMIASYRSIYSQEGVKHTTLFEGAADLFERLKRGGIRTVVLSNKGHKAVEDSLKYFDLHQHVDLTIADGTFPGRDVKMKPHPMVYTELIKPSLRIRNDGDVLMVGDTSSDILFANNCAISSCWARYGYGEVAECERLMPTHVVTRLTELLRL